MDPLPPEILLPLLIPALWVIVLLVIGHAGGWQALSAVYRTHEDFHGTLWRFQSVQLRWPLGNYNNCVTVGAGPHGLYLAVFGLFRVGHPPLLVPWHDVTMEERKTLFGPRSVVRFRQAPNVTLSVSKRLGDRLRETIGETGRGP